MILERQPQRLVIDHHLLRRAHQRECHVGLLPQFARAGGGEQRQCCIGGAADFPQGLPPIERDRPERIDIREQPERALRERRTPDAALPLFAAASARELGEETDLALPAMSEAEHVVADYQMTRLSLKDHPMHFLRDTLDAEGVSSCAATSAARNGQRVRTAGIVLVRQRPGNGKAIFVTIEDETGVTNIVLWERTFERFRREVMSARLMMVEGEVQKAGPRDGNVVHLMATRIFDRTDMLDHLSNSDRKTLHLMPCDEFESGQPSRYPGRPDTPPTGHNTPRHGHPRDVRIIPKSRDFH